MEIKQKKIEAQGIRFFIILDGEEVASAYLYLLKNNHHKRPFGLIEYVIISEKLRGQGIGTRVVKEMIETAKKENCYKLILTSRHSKPKVHELYEKLGFEDWGKEFRMNF